MESPITFIKGDKIGFETDYRDYLPENMSGVVRPILGADGYMLQQPGLTKYSDGVGLDRGGLWNERLSNHFRVSGANPIDGGSLIEIDASGNTAILGAISGTDKVSMPYSFNTQGIVADGRFYLYDPSNGFREVTDPDLGDPIDCVWVDGYYFFTDGEYLYHTDLADESAIDPLKFATAEFSPDPTIGVAKAIDNKVMAFGRYTIEYFINDASENFAFQRVQTRAVKAGIVGTHCKAEMLDKFYILGGRKEEGVAVHVVGVGTVNKVSSREVDKVIGKYTENELSTCTLEARVEDDYQYLILHLPSEVLLFNAKVASVLGNEYAWSILKTGTEKTPWRAIHGVFEPRKGVWVYGDKQGANIGVLDETVSTQYEEIAEWTLNTPFMKLEYSSIDELEIETMPGHTTTSDGVVSISLTYDGIAHGTEWFEMYGLPSDYGKRFVIRRLGYVRDWVGIKLRGATRSRMGFGAAKIAHG